MIQSTISQIEVHDDQHELTEASVRAALAPHGVAINPRTGEPNIHPDQHDDHVKAYLESAHAQDHVDHLHAAFKVKKAPPTPPPPATEKAVP